ncbi:MAG: lamin tail domain-containing protein [Candidatus Pacebacteria bacterium]|nr:lamin tail domain-containing protein [Candidatus Paceibacterota bacterium]
MIIKEFLPNPVGSDKEGEYIKIFNDGDIAVILKDWQIKDASGKAYELNGALDAGDEMNLPYLQTKITLNNNGEKIFLYNNAGKLIDELGYSGMAEEGMIIQRKIAGDKQQEIKDVAGGRINYQPISGKIFFLDFLTAGILAGLALWLILKIEENTETKLF